MGVGRSFRCYPAQTDVRGYFTLKLLAQWET